MDTSKHGQSDPELVIRIQKDDLNAFKIFYDRYHALIYHLSFSFLKSREMAEESVQDVFLKIWEHRARLDPDRPVKAYLIKCCKNHLINQLTKTDYKTLRYQNEIDFDIVSSDNTLNDLILSEYMDQAEFFISNLPPKRQKVFRMFRFENLSLDDIANELGTSKGTVKDHLLKAHRYLKEALSLSRHTV